jgi:hypothetical protein
MSHADFRSESLRAFIKAGPQDELDTVALNCMLLQWISTQLSVQFPHSTQLITANRVASAALNMVTHVKFYDFMAKTDAERLQFAFLRRLPQPKSMRLEAHLKAGYQVGAVVELLASCEGVEMPSGLSPDSLELTQALFAVCRTFATPPSGRELLVVSGDHEHDVTLSAEIAAPVFDWRLEAALRAYREVASLADPEPEHISIVV